MQTTSTTMHWPSGQAFDCSASLLTTGEKWHRVARLAHDVIAFHGSITKVALPHPFQG